MELVDLLALNNGVVGWATAVRVCGEGRVRRAVAAGELIKIRRGLYADPRLDQAQRRARVAGGVLSHRSAAIAHGLEVLAAPPLPEVIVPRNSRKASRGVEQRYRCLTPSEHEGGVTSVLRTVVDCARDLAFVDALVIADSALRAGLEEDELKATLWSVRANGRRQATRVAVHACGRAANPFESALRAIALDYAPLRLVPQLFLPELGIRPDLTDPELKVVLEADSFSFHSSAEALTSDIERYNALRLSGYLCLRFGYEHVIRRQDYVRSQIEAGLRLLGVRMRSARVGKSV